MERLFIVPGCQAMITTGPLSGSTVTVVRRLVDADLLMFVHEGLHLRCDEDQVGQWFTTVNNPRSNVTHHANGSIVTCLCATDAGLCRIDGGSFNYGDNDAY